MILFPPWTALGQGNFLYIPCFPTCVASISLLSGALAPPPPRHPSSGKWSSPPSRPQVWFQKARALLVLLPRSSSPLM